jgi:hypothetical protein
MPLLEATVGEVVDRCMEDMMGNPFSVPADVERESRWKETAQRHSLFSERIRNLGRRMNLATAISHTEPSLYSVICYRTDLNVYRPAPRTLLTLLAMSEVLPEYGRGISPNYRQDYVENKGAMIKVIDHLVEVTEPPSMNINDVTLSQVVKGYLDGKILPTSFTRSLYAHS